MARPWGFQTTDGRSIANLAAATMKASGLNVRVENFGVVSFQSSLELVKFTALIARVPEDRLLQMVICYDGFNDVNHGFYFSAGNMQNDLSSKLAALVERRSHILLVYAASQTLARYSAFWRRHGHPRFEKRLFHDPNPNHDQANLQQAVDIYIRNTRMADAVCAAIDARCFFVLQPLITSKTTHGPIEQEVLAEKRPGLLAFARNFCRQVVAELGSHPGFIDASAVLNGRSDDVSYDLGHVSACGVPKSASSSPANSWDALGVALRAW